MTDDALAIAEPRAARLRSGLSLAAYIVTAILLAGTFFLISPPDVPGYSGAIAWRPMSLLKPLTDAMGLWGAARTPQGVEIKDFAFHLAAAIGLILLAARAAVSGLLPPEHRTGKGAWFFGQVLLIGWVALSASSSIWARDGELALGQAALYGLAVAWAIALCWTLEARDIPRLLWTYVFVAAAGASLCIWYFNERNPDHRPGFPIGNPSSLAACILPAIAISLCTLIGALMPHEGRPVSRRAARILASLAALIPLIGCFYLTNSRGALIGLVVGFAGLLFILAQRRTRVALVVLALVGAAAGIWFFSSQMQDLAMARGATIRFRVYAWQYAARLWSFRPISGHGAGSYPTLAGQEGITDRALDPAAFMGDAVEHAHNELFEVLAEIGLIGGLTFVGGFLATLAAASALLQTNASPERRWLLFGLVAGLIGLMADAMFGVGLRLPGGSAVFYTLLGVVWAASRAVSKRRHHLAADGALQRRQTLRRYIVAGIALCSGIVAGVLALRNLSGATMLHDAEQLLRNGEPRLAAKSIMIAEGFLLDPVRRLIAREAEVRALTAWGASERREFEGLLAQSSSNAVGPAAMRDAWTRAVQTCRDAYEAGAALNRTAPTFGRPAGMAAQSAESLSRLYRGRDERESANWASHAFTAWATQRTQRPYDPATLLALTRFRVFTPETVGEFIGLLRDALRGGPPTAEWFRALESGAALPGFEEKLADMLQAAGSYGPNTELDALIISGAAEMRRLNAAWLARKGDFESAVRETAAAVELYGPMRARFNTLESVALTEQADYAFREAPDQPERAAQLVEAAIAALPQIQAQKLAELARLPRERLIHYLLAAGDEAGAAEIIRLLLGDQATDPQSVAAALEVARSRARLEVWAWKCWHAAHRGDVLSLRRALADAAAAGVSAAELDEIRRSIFSQFPALEERLREPAP